MYLNKNDDATITQFGIWKTALTEDNIKKLADGEDPMRLAIGGGAGGQEDEEDNLCS